MYLRICDCICGNSHKAIGFADGGVVHRVLLVNCYGLVLLCKMGYILYFKNESTGQTRKFILNNCFCCLQNLLMY